MVFVSKATFLANVQAYIPDCTLPMFEDKIVRAWL